MKYTNILFALLGIIFCSTSFLKNTKADGFYPAGKIDQCNFASTIGVQYSNLPADIQYDEDKIRGAGDNWIQSHVFKDVASVSYPDARRHSGVIDKISVPPNTDVEMGVFVWNYTGHWVDTNNLYLFTSQANPNDGDLTKLGAGGSYGKISFDGGARSKSGKYLKLPGVGGFSNRSDDKGRLFYSFKTIQPIKISSRNLEYEFLNGDLILHYSLGVKNTSQYDICDVSIEDHLPNSEVYRETLCLDSGQNKVVSYDANLGSEYSSEIIDDEVTVSDNNYYTESNASHYTNNSDYYNFDARALYVSRNDSSSSSWYGLQPAWGQSDRDLITVEIIPYSLSGPSVGVDISPVLSIKKEVSDSDEDKVEANLSNVGELITYRLSITNAGGRVDSLNVLDIFPHRYLEIIDKNGGDIDDDGRLSWEIDLLEHGQTRHISYSARVKEYTTEKIINTAMVNVSGSEDSEEVESSTFTTLLPESYSNGLLEKTGTSITPYIYLAASLLVVAIGLLMIGRYLEKLPSIV